MHGHFQHPLRGHAADLPGEPVEVVERNACRHQSFDHVAACQGAVERLQQAAHEVVAYQGHLLIAGRGLPQIFDLFVDLVEGGPAHLSTHFGAYAQVGIPLQRPGGRGDAVGVAFFLAYVTHQPGAEVSAQEGEGEREGREIGMVPVDRAFSQGEGRLHGILPGDGLPRCCRRGRGRSLPQLRSCPAGIFPAEAFFDVPEQSLIDLAGKHQETVVAVDVAGMPLLQVGGGDLSVVRYLPAEAVGMVPAVDLLQKSGIGLIAHLLRFDDKGLLFLLQPGLYLLFREYGVVQDIVEDLQHRCGMTPQGIQAETGIVAGIIGEDIAAVIIEQLGDGLRITCAGPFPQGVDGGLADQRLLLGPCAAGENEVETYRLQPRRRERVQAVASRQHPLAGRLPSYVLHRKDGRGDGSVWNHI